MQEEKQCRTATICIAAIAKARLFFSKLLHKLYTIEALQRSSEGAAAEDSDRDGCVDATG